MRIFTGLCLLNLTMSGYALSFDDIKGEANNNLEIEVGSFLYHISDLYKHVQRDGKYYFKPMILASKYGIVGGYFKNSHYRDSFALAIRRYWFTSKGKYFDYDVGYSLGIVSGYCTTGGMEIYEDCTGNAKHQIAPYGQAFLKVRNDKVSLNLSYSIAIVFASLSYFFD